MNILRAITDDYISSAEPVGSRTIARKYNLGVSPATIRNEMADLEEMGYLEQPHTSAGRIPSDTGYRFYVDALMDPTEMTGPELECLREDMLAKQRAMEELIHRAARILSQMSRYTAIVMTPRLSETIVRRVHLTLLNEFTFLIVLITDPGFVQNQIIESHVPLDNVTLDRVSERLNRVLVGKSLREITKDLLSHLKESIDWAYLYDEIVELLLRSLDNEASERVFLDGALYLFDQPEFRDMERVKSLLRFLEEPDSLIDIVGNTASHASIEITIGKEHTNSEMQQCSMVTATYSIGSNVIGTVGVVGPTRLDYAKVVGIVRGLANSLSGVLTDMSSRG